MLPVLAHVTALTSSVEAVFRHGRGRRLDVGRSLEIQYLIHCRPMQTHIHACTYSCAADVTSYLYGASMIEKSANTYFDRRVQVSGSGFYSSPSKADRTTWS